MSSFDEIEKMQGMVDTLSPLLSEYLGLLKNPDGTTSDQPAICLGSNLVPESTLPRVILTYQGSQTGYCVGQDVREELNPDYDSSDEDSNEYLYYMDNKFHLEYLVTFTVDSGDATEVLQGNRKSAAWLSRHIRNLLTLESVRESIHDNCDSGVHSIVSETSISSLDGVTRIDGSNILVNFTTEDVLSEQLLGVIETVVVDGTVDGKETTTTVTKP